MSALDREFNRLAKDQRSKYPPPFSLRFTFDDADKLPSAQQRREEIAKRMSAQLHKYALEINKAYHQKHPSIEFKRAQTVERHRAERKALDEMQRLRWDKETAARAARLHKGIGGLWSRLTGKYSKIRTQNELETWRCYCRDQAERDAMVSRQLDERQQLQRAIKQMRDQRSKDIADLHLELSAFLSMERGNAATAAVQVRMLAPIVQRPHILTRLEINLAVKALV